ncbi:aldose epimerase family protein [Nocardia sp. NBC_00403]|uniref:aldose epimerase family protein n=1 Tax=Nocardia sp. NBC_00403 TaxID=2975990 RepID=UPI002E1F407F
MTTDDITLTAGDVRLTVSAGTGGRISSFTVDDVELLRQGATFGCFPMAPWCGRIRDGRFTNGSVVHQLPLNAAPHAIHGTVRDRPWKVTRTSGTEAVLTQELAAPWPFAGRVTQSFALTPDSVALTMGITADADAFPAQAGWHPWFNRNPVPGRTGVAIEFSPDWQEERGSDYLPTGQRIEPRPGPWDDCFGMPSGVDVTLVWPEFLELNIASPEQWVVVFDMTDEAVCVEPQSGPPNGLDTLPRLVTPDAPLAIESSWRLRRL